MWGRWTCERIVCRRPHRRRAKHPGRARRGGVLTGAGSAQHTAGISFILASSPGDKNCCCLGFAGRKFSLGEFKRHVQDALLLRIHGTHLRGSDPLLIGRVCCLQGGGSQGSSCAVGARRLPRPPASASSVASHVPAAPAPGKATLSCVWPPGPRAAPTPAQRPDGRRAQETPGPSASHC